MDLCESAPDQYIRYTYPQLLDESREAVAKVLNAPVDTVVYVPNATTGVNVVLRNLVWNPDGKDEILYFNTIYGASGKSIEYTCEANNDLVRPREIPLTYPIEDSDLIALFKKAIKASRAARKFPRVAVFDTVSSMPGLAVPYKELTAICHEEGILSLIDAAHAIGHIPLDLTALDPDFFVSNCHKWLFAPRGCAVLYVPKRNQALIRSSLPTSHGFVPRPGASSGTPNPLDVSSKSEFVNNFEFVGTVDNSSFVVVPEAIKWREQVCGGEKAIMEYNTDLTRRAGSLVAQILGTKVLDNSTQTLTNCCLVNVLLPLTPSKEKIPGTNTIDPQYGMQASQWMQRILLAEFKTFIPIFFFQDQWWARLSGQVYLELADFEWAAATLKELCERAANTEFA